MSTTAHDTQPSANRPLRTERFDTVVIGAGQAGLAVARELTERDIDTIVLSDEAHVGDNWRRRWDSLRLFTPAEHSGLPGMPFPAPNGHFPDKDEVGDYLERYATRFDLPVRTATPVVALSHDGERFVVRSRDGVIEAASVVIAIGAYQVPRTPPISMRLSNEIHQLHSKEYRSPWTLPEGPVLVAGAGNSGAQIALELARFRKVWLAGRDTGRMPRRVLGRDVFHWTWPIMTRATLDTRLGRRLRGKALRGGDPILGMSRSAFRAAGVTRVPRVEDERGGFPVCGGDVVRPRAIVWATGYAPDYSWIDIPVFGDDGYPRHRRGVVADCAGLYFLGLRFQYRLSSSLLGGVGADAVFIADQIARQVFGATEHDG
ncbi:MAG TPA: NAD(P)/FAD-dependent oxidoreductase [Gemmatimonadaceae bacterium]